MMNPARRADINGAIHNLNARIRDLARDTRFPFYDLNRDLAREGQLADEMTTDGLHLTRAAYVAWEWAIDACVRALADGQPIHVCRGSIAE